MSIVIIYLKQSISKSVKAERLVSRAALTMTLGSDNVMASAAVILQYVWQRVWWLWAAVTKDKVCSLFRPHMYTSRGATAATQTRHSRWSDGASYMRWQNPGRVGHVEASLVVLLVHKGDCNVVFEAIFLGKGSVIVIAWDNLNLMIYKSWFKPFSLTYDFDLNLSVRDKWFKLF